jgi:hypothetical protein
MRYLPVVGVLVLSACSGLSPTAPLGPAPICHFTDGPVVLRVLVIGHVSQRPVSNESMQIRATNCAQDWRTATTNAEGVAEWRLADGSYILRFRGWDGAPRTVPMVSDLQWLISLPE